ncbi:Thioredoxin domain containing protein [Asbolus verrucosus]|uniref:Protein disulfide-isomerase n=1 Tax=Asbolus verrucosus TaxID=1661398 RepID=A0A482VRT6_ASBVE|nr:Thioredoxin domain containing protein [Asbolus verrucosus]
MHLNKIFVLCILLYLCLAEKDYVLELNDNDFDKEIAQHGIAVVMFYAPWCGHCKKLKPEYEKAAEEMNRNDPSVAFIKIDCTEAGKETCSKYNIESYPTLKIFQSGEFSQDYDGPRKASGIVDYIEARIGPSSKEITSIEDLDKFVTMKNDVCVVGFFEKETELKEIFLKLADKLREKVKFAHSSSKSVLEKERIVNGIVLFRQSYLRNKFEEARVAYTGKAASEDINDFIAKNYHGLVGHRKPENREDFKNPSVIAYYDIDYSKNPKGTNYWRNRILKIALQYKNQITFAMSSKDDFHHELSDYDFDIASENKPFVVAKNTKEQKFVLKDPFSVEALEKFVKNFLEGTLEPYLKSEPIPEINDGPVIIAVAKSFDELVVNNDKDTLVEFYAPWCGHCKRLTPVYEQLAQKLKDEDVVVVKMDATANEIPTNYSISSYPSIYWVPKNSKNNPVLYEGERKLEDFIKYVAKHATNELNGYDRNGSAKVEKDEL